MNMTYKTNRLLLKTLDESYSIQVLDFYSNNKAHLEPWEPERVQSFYTNAFWNKSLALELEHMKENKLLRFWIFLKENPNQIIGTFCFQNITKGIFYSATLSYKIDYAYSQKGYMTEALCFGIPFIQKFHEIHRIEAYVDPKNYPSIRLLHKLNFRYEGICYSSVKLHEIWGDLLRYSYIFSCI